MDLVPKSPLYSFEPYRNSSPFSRAAVAQVGGNASQSSDVAASSAHELLAEFFYPVRPKPKPVFYFTADSAPPTASSLQLFLSVGRIQEALRFVEKMLETQSFAPHERLRWKHAYAALLIRHGQIESAEEVLNKLGNLNADSYTYEAYPSFYPLLKGNMVPFTLRMLLAQFPMLRATSKKAEDQKSILADTALSQERFFELLFLCQSNMKSAFPRCELQKQLGDKNSEKIDHHPLQDEKDSSAAFVSDSFSLEDNSAEQWEERELSVNMELVNCHVLQNQQQCAINLLTSVLRRYTPENRQKRPQGQIEYMNLLTRLGELHLQVGQLGSAEDAFTRLEAIDERGLSPTGLEHLEVSCLLNKANLLMAQSQYAQAYETYNLVLHKKPDNVIAVNNQAVCLLYNSNLLEAINVLEESIRVSPSKLAEEPVYFNLCTLYDLNAEDGVHKKHVLHAVAQNYCGDSHPKHFK